MKSKMDQLLEGAPQRTKHSPIRGFFEPRPLVQSHTPALRGGGLKAVQGVVAMSRSPKQGILLCVLLLPATLLHCCSAFVFSAPRPLSAARMARASTLRPFRVGPRQLPCVSLSSGPDPGLPMVEIEYCTGCRWMLRAAWLAQELLTTFEKDIRGVLLLPSRPPSPSGTFDIRYLRRSTRALGCNTGA